MEARRKATAPPASARLGITVKEFRKVKDEATALSRDESAKVVQAERNKIAKMLKKQERVLFGK